MATRFCCQKHGAYPGISPFQPPVQFCQDVLGLAALWPAAQLGKGCHCHGEPHQPAFAQPITELSDLVTL